MKRALLLCAAMTLCATPAFAVGSDLSVVACPGNPGVSSYANLDCAAGQTVTLLATFMPNEAIPDLVGIDMILDLLADGDLGADASFWDFGNANTLGSHEARPASGCSNYADTWAETGSGSAFATIRRQSSVLRISAVGFRPTPIAVDRNQRLFGIQLTIDTSTSLESGSGTLLGCKKRTTIVMNQLTPGSASGTTTTLVTGSLFSNLVELNLDAVPTLSHTWGQLKSLYR